MSSTKTSFKNYSRIIIIPLKRKNSNVRKTCSKKAKTCSFMMNTSTPLFSSTNKLGSDKISSISLLRNELGHTILRIPILSLLFDAFNIRSSDVATIQGKCD